MKIYHHTATRLGKSITSQKISLKIFNLCLIPTECNINEINKNNDWAITLQKVPITAKFLEKHFRM